MKKIIAVLLALFFIGGTLNVVEMLRIPNLVEHFFHHQEHQAINFVPFINSHYSGMENDKDAKEDNSLPFKSQLPNIFSFHFFKVIESGNSIVFNGYLSSLLPIRNSFTPSVGNKSEIWQPPRKKYFIT